MAGDYYSRISARFWIDSKGWGERNQLVALYLLTNTHSTMEGLYHLPLGYLCADLGLTPKQAQAALTFIESAGVVSYDARAEVVFIRKALKHGAPKTKNHITGAVNRLKSVPSSPLWDEFRMACECHASELAEAIRMALGTPLASSISSSGSIPPKSPQGGHDIAPSKPSGGRTRDVRAYEDAMSDWAARYFPDAKSVKAVIGAVSWMSTRDGIDEVTPAALREFAASSDTWADPLGLSTKEVA